MRGRRSRPRKTEGKSGTGRTTFAYRFDFHGLKFEADDAFGGLSSPDDQWFRTTFAVYCGELSDRASHGVSKAISKGRRLEATHKKVLSDEMEAAAGALLRGESYETPEGGRQLARLKVSPALTSGRMTISGVRDTLPGVPHIDPHKITRDRIDQPAAIPTADRGTLVKRGPDALGAGRAEAAIASVHEGPPSPRDNRHQARRTSRTRCLRSARCDEVMTSQTESVRAVPPEVARDPKGRGERRRRRSPERGIRSSKS